MGSSLRPKSFNLVAYMHERTMSLYQFFVVFGFGFHMEIDRDIWLTLESIIHNLILFILGPYLFAWCRDMKNSRYLVKKANKILFWLKFIKARLICHEKIEINLGDERVDQLSSNEHDKQLVDNTSDRCDDAFVQRSSIEMQKGFQRPIS